MNYEQLVKALRHCANQDTICTKVKNCGYWKDGTFLCQDAMMTDAAAAIEALQEQLPKRGEWIDRYDEDDKPFFKRKYVCSACGVWNTYGKSDYCPKCGAKMEVQDG